VEDGFCVRVLRRDGGYLSAQLYLMVVPYQHKMVGRCQCLPFLPGNGGAEKTLLISSNSTTFQGCLHLQLHQLSTTLKR